MGSIIVDWLISSPSLGGTCIIHIRVVLTIMTRYKVAMASIKNGTLLLC